MKKTAQMIFMAIIAAAFCALTATAQTTPRARIVVPERFRVLTNQFFDLRVEAEGIVNSERTKFQIIVENDNGTESLNFTGPLEQTSDNDADPNSFDRAWTYRRVSFNTPGIKTIRALIFVGRNIYGVSTQISVQDFNLAAQKSVVLYIGDAMGMAYRDASRIVGQSTNNRFREGWFDDLQQMDKMPVTGTVMTHALDQITPDSANTGTAWACGNKTVDGALNVFPDNNDFRYNSSNIQATKQFVLDNPRVETLWQYLKRRHGYKTGIVTSSDVTDATPAAQGAHSLLRGLGYDIARQYADGTITNGGQFDVIMGGGLERFNARTAANSGDTRNLVTELQATGYAVPTNRAQLNALPATTGKILGLFRTGNMNVAYDKLRLTRPADEPAPNFGGFEDQPYLDEMTSKAIDALKRDGSPFILMVEGSSIDKQSHPNHAAGQIWDTIELDKAIGVGRNFLNTSATTRANTLLITTADHDQSLTIIGASNTTVSGAIQNVRSTLTYPNPGRLAGESEGFPNYEDVNGDRYPENLNTLKIMVGFRTGNHTGSSVPLSAEGAGALLFFGHYDQTDIFFKTARVLSLNTRPLDDALAAKLGVDVPYFTPFLPLSRSLPAGVTMLPNAPLTKPGLLSGEDTHGHADGHR
jgi:alkaline phosphatase